MTTEQKNFLQALAAALQDEINEFYNEKMGFALIVFEFNTGQSVYISNAKREDMIKALRETVNRIEKNAVIPPTVGSA